MDSGLSYYLGISVTILAEIPLSKSKKLSMNFRYPYVNIINSYVRSICMCMLSPSK